MKLVLVQPRLSYDAPIENPGLIRHLLEPLSASLGSDDLVLLPEHYDLRPTRADYEDDVRGLARMLGCHVIGGSHHELRDGRRVNAGVVSDSTGQIVARYEKFRPYAAERSRVEPGTALGELRIAGKRLLVLVCADFWFSDLFHRTTELPDLVLVPAHSVTRKPAPDYSRALWRHLAVARAYEFGVYVGVSDWAYLARQLPPGLLPASGVGGFADPTQVDPAALYAPISGEVQTYEIDFAALDAFRRDRYSRGFFWRPALP